jgi:carotenoid cleavage dioxygenase-like enzyme
MCALLNTAAALAGEIKLTEDDKKWRYKIFTAEHQAIEKGGNKLIKSIFKIDLETGKVWRYRQGIDGEGKKYEEFFEVPEQ